MNVSLNGFLTQVRAIEQTLDLRDSMVVFGQDQASYLIPSAAMLRQSIRQIGLAGMQPSLDGSLLLIAAAFEQFVSDVIIEFTGAFPRIVPVYEDLPCAVRSANEQLTGAALSTNRSRFKEYELRRFIRNLRGCQSGVMPYVLNGEAIAFNSRNLSAGTLQNLISRVGVADIWSSVARTHHLISWSSSGSVSVAQSRAKNRLNELIEDRNQIAHRVGATTPGPEVVRSYIDFEEALARSLVEGLEDYAKSL